MGDQPPPHHFAEAVRRMAASLAQALLLYARGLIERGWCQGATGRDAHGNRVDPWSPEARTWSAVGAFVAGYSQMRDMYSEMGEIVPDREAVFSAFHEANLALLAAIGDALQPWNDSPSRTQEDVYSAFTRAIDYVDP
jgi:hypothetical protein